MKTSDDELISRIKAGLQDYEEPYVAGTWENFNQGQKSKNGTKFRLRAWSSAAAVLLAGLGWLIHLNSVVNQEYIQITSSKKRTEPVIIRDETGHSPAVSIKQQEMNDELITVQKKYSFPDQNAAASTDQHELNIKSIEHSEASATGLVSTVGFTSDTSAVLVDSRAIVVNTVTKDSAVSKVSFAEFLATEINSTSQGTSEPVTGRANSKWNMGLVVSPFYGNAKKLTMGYGVSMTYALSEKVSLNSGFSINQLAAEKDFGQPESTILLNGKVLESAESNLTGIDIPLDVKYYLSKNVYANIGVSAFSVLDQSRENTFVEAKLIERAVSTAEGKQETRTMVEHQRTIEKVPDADLESSRYLGLYNFSLGFKQKVSKRKFISIEPFVKVPFKERKKEDLKIFATGLRLKLEI